MNFEPSFFSFVYDLDFSGVGVWNGFVDMFLILLMIVSPDQHKKVPV